ncbi:MAG: hypothetical protein DRQ24_06355 [Candidatus Latescibacterota bacterium]|nr:MAG: hypothetical protein DRQ24_06355 [Candidatus Latescibacterota bacterium]
MVLHLMLAGRIRLCEPATRLKLRTCLRLGLNNPVELRYSDFQLIGRVYLVGDNEFSNILISQFRP